MTTQNPLLKTSEFFDQAPNFPSFKPEHFMPALQLAIAHSMENVDRIRQTAAEPNFENTILAYECCSEQVDFVSNIFSNLELTNSSDEMQKISQEFYPRLSAFSSDLSLDPVIFSRVKKVHDHPVQLGLTYEQIRLTEKIYTNFVRNGALLSETDKEKIRKIDDEMSTLSPKFSENVLKATNAFEMVLSNRQDLDGLPEGAIEAAAHLAETKGKKGQWIFNLHYPSYAPFSTYAKNRSLREKMWRAYGSKAFNDSFDNQQIILRTIQLRNERAQLLGYSTHADYVLSQRMAEEPEVVFDFMQNMITKAKPAALKDIEEIKDFAKELDGIQELMPWDLSYYSEKLKEKKYHFNEEDLRPYFKLENVVDGLFLHAEKLYGIQFKENNSIPLYHPEVKAYEVYDAEKKYVGLFYTDFFPRESKKGGAWMTNFREQGTWGGTVKRPHVSIVCNFTKPTPTKPSLLTFDEVSTAFHEFGHALHGLLSQCTYKSIAGTNVKWDFVELPSQIMENWIKEKESLDMFAKHYETNEPMPLELIEKLKKSMQFQAGLACLRQMNFAMMDMKWHTTNPSEIKNVDDFETMATAETRLMPKIPGTNSSCAFGHIFAGGYSAGYYSYKWAEVLDADAFECFKENGIFNKTIARKFLDTILSKGDTEQPMELFKKFRGRAPSVDALLRRDGLIS